MAYILASVIGFPHFSLASYEIKAFLLLLFCLLLHDIASASVSIYLIEKAAKSRKIALKIFLDTIFASVIFFHCAVFYNASISASFLFNSEVSTSFVLQQFFIMYIAMLRNFVVNAELAHLVGEGLLEYFVSSSALLPTLLYLSAGLLGLIIQFLEPVLRKPLRIILTRLSEAKESVFAVIGAGAGLVSVVVERLVIWVKGA